MKVLRIFEIPKTNSKLFAAQFEGEHEDKNGNERNAFSNLRHQWMDDEYLREYFQTYQQDYFKFYGRGILRSNIKECKKQALDFFLDLVERCSYRSNKKLNELFKPLDNKESPKLAYELQPLKAKGQQRKSYLRIYALRYNNEFVLTGGQLSLFIK